MSDVLSRRELLGRGAAAAGGLLLAGSAGAMLAPPKRLYVSVRDGILMAGGYASVAEGLAACGIAGVEIGVSGDCSVGALIAGTGKDRLMLDSDDDLKTLAQQAAQAKARISGFLVPNNFNAKDKEAQIAWVVKVVEAAAKLKVPALRIDAIMDDAASMTLEERQSVFAACTTKVLDQTKRCAVDLGVENHGVQGNDPEFLEGLIKRVGSRRLGITMDMGNFYWAGYPLDTLYDILKRLAPHTKHTHVKNIKYPEALRNTRREPGYDYGRCCCPIPEGDIDIAKVVGFLKAAGYSRDLCIEDESLGRYDQATRRATLKSTAEFLAKLV